MITWNDIVSAINLLYVTYFSNFVTKFVFIRQIKQLIVRAKGIVFN